MKKGFTLIELLVVVLIIGILSAVALPQYQKAIIRTRLSNIQQIVASFKLAEEAYYLANGAYTNDSTLLDVDFSICPPRAEGSDVLICDNYFMMDPLGSTEGMYLTAYYCPAEVAVKASSGTCAGNADFYYRVWLDNSTYPRRIECGGQSDMGKTLCKNMCGSNYCYLVN